MLVVNKDSKVLQFQDTVVPRPNVIPYNRIDHNKIYAAGYTDGIFMVVFRNNEGKPDDKISYFRLVDIKTINHVINSDKEWCDSFLENAYNGLYPCYIEQESVYHI